MASGSFSGIVDGGLAADHYEGHIPGDMVEVAEAIMARRATDFDPKQLRDPFQHNLRQLVDEKARSAPPVREEQWAWARPTAISSNPSPNL